MTEAHAILDNLGIDTSRPLISQISRFDPGRIRGRLSMPIASPSNRFTDAGRIGQQEVNAFQSVFQRHSSAFDPRGIRLDRDGSDVEGETGDRNASGWDRRSDPARPDWLSCRG